MVCTIDSASSSESSYEVVSSTVSRFCACATSASSSALISGQLACAALLRDEADEVAYELVGVGGELLEHLALPGRLDLRVAQERAQLGHLVHRAGERSEIGRDRVDPVGFLRRLEERARVHALRDGH